MALSGANLKANLSANLGANLNRRSFLVLSCGMVVNLAFGKGTNKGESRNLFVYYTRTLNTHILVTYAQSLISGDLAQIHTIDAYPQDYQLSVALAAKQRAEGILPPLHPYTLDLQNYDNIFVAAPLWDMDLCAPMKTFLHSANVGDKAIHLIITNAGYGLGKSVDSAKSYANVSAVLDYAFKDYEKIVPNLLSINMAEISQNKAFDKLDKPKISHFLRAFL